MSKLGKANSIARFMRSLPVVIFILCLFSTSVSQAQFKNEEELKKQAAKYFEDEEYAEGFKLYSQLLANYPKDPIYNFRLGVCMLYTDPDKRKPIPYLQQATKDTKNGEKEALFYLGKAYHFNFRFDDAIKYYVQYKDVASSSMAKKLQVDREIQACKNGKRLLANVEELVVLDKKELNEVDYFRSYDLQEIGGKLLVKPDEFKTPTDKKKKDKSVIYLSKNNREIYYGGYGEKADNRDIFVVRKLPNGQWSKPELVGPPINTEFDEDYPFVHPNGRVLYFASKGHNSMGGYDLFKSEKDETTNRWKEPVNLDFPINTPNDDILFVTDSLEKIAFFGSTRQSPYGKVDVYKILTEKRPAEFAHIRGSVLKTSDAQSVESKIKIKNIDNGEDVGTFSANEKGEYNLKLPNGGKFIFTVETPGFPTQSEGVNIPTAYTYVPYKQLIGYDGQKLYITNFFETKEEDENNYTEMLDLIAEKSKMDVNAEELGVSPQNPLAASKNNNTVANNENKNAAAANPANETASTNPSKNLSNRELIKMAYEDAKELQQSADTLKREAANAFAAANSKQDQANAAKKEVDETQAKLNAESDPSKKTELAALEEKQKDEANLYAAQANTANNMAKQLEVDAENKKKEADLNLQYAKALEEAEKTKNNKEAIAKLESLQKQLEEASKQKSGSNALLENIKADAANKQTELAAAEKKQEQLNSDVSDINKEIENLDKQIGETKDNDLKENLKGQKQEQESDLADKKKEIDVNTAKINTLKEEADALKSQAEFAAGMINGNVETNVAAANNQHTSNNTAVPSNESKAGNNAVAANNASTQNNNPSLSANENAAANNPSTQNETANTVNNTTENKNNEVSSAAENATLNNNSANQNETANDNVATENNASTENPSATANEETNATNTSASSQNKYSENKNLGEEKKLFNTVTYTDPKAQQLKQQAEEKLNQLVDENKSLVGELNKISAEQNNAGANGQGTIDGLNKQADEFTAEARKLRAEAKTMTGTDKQNAMNRIQSLEQQAAEARYKSASQQFEIDKELVAANESDIKELLKLPANKANAARVNELVNEAKALSANAEKLKQEAEADPSPGSRVGGLGNADEKQKEALAKQQQAMGMLKGEVDKVAKNNSQETQLKTKLEEENKINNSALKTLSDANKTEYTAALTKLNADEKKGTSSTEEKQLKAEAQKEMADANAELAKVSAIKNEEEKSKELIAVNEKMEDAVNKLKQADGFVNGEAVAVNNNAATNPANENTTENTNNQNENSGTAISNENATNANPSTNLNTNASTENNTVANNENSATNPSNTGITNNNTANENTALPANSNGNENAAVNPSNATNANETANNNQNPAVNETTSTVTTNTGTPANKLSVQETAAVKASPEYKEYATLQKETVKYNAQAEKDNAQAQLYKNKSAENLRRAETLKTEAAALPEGTEKQDKLQQAAKLEDSSGKLKEKADSLQSVAEDTKRLAESKQQEEEAYVSSLDANKRSEIQAVALNENANPAANNTTAVANNNINTPPAGNFSDSYKRMSDRISTQLGSLEEGNASTDNLRMEDGLITDYIQLNTAEISSKKKEQASVTSAADKNRIATEIKSLQNKNTELNKKLLANQKQIKQNVAIAAGNTTNNPVATTNTAANNASNNTPVNEARNNTATNPSLNPATFGSTEAQKYIGTKGFEVKNNNAYSETKPIPINEKLPDGIVFRVQIGAFKNPIPTDQFKGLTPVGGETTPQGFIRYQAGMFDQYNKANAVKNDLKKLGYKDAFVVAYKNGKRVNLNEALDSLQKSGQPVNTDIAATAGITAESNVSQNVTPIASEVSTNSPLAKATEIKEVNGILFTIQVGVYTNNVSSGQLYDLNPIFREHLTNGNYRYTAGVYNDIEKARADRIRVNAIGIKDAFVTAYLNGERIIATDAMARIKNDNTVKLSAEQPIIFPNENRAITPAVTNTVNTNTPQNTTAVPETFNNGVAEGPAPTAENGVKLDEAGITFKVQIGAYKNKVPEAVANEWRKEKTWPIKVTLINDLHLYTIGSFSEARFAQKLREEAISIGIKDAFVTVFKDGKKLYGAEALKYIQR